MAERQHQLKELSSGAANPIHHSKGRGQGAPPRSRSPPSTLEASCILIWKSCSNCRPKDLALLATDRELKALDDQIAALDAALDRARSDVEAARKKHADGVKRREDLEGVIETQRSQQEKRRARIEQVRTAREVQALMTEVDLARSMLANKESDWVKAAEANQQQEAAVAEAEQRLAAPGGRSDR